MKILLFGTKPIGKSNAKSLFFFSSLVGNLLLYTRYSVGLGGMMLGKRRGKFFLFGFLARKD